MRALIGAMVVMAVLFIGILPAAGCEAPATTMETAEVTTCPVCGEELKVMPTAECPYTEGICPVCGQRYEVWDGFKALHSEVRVCGECEVIVEPCPVHSGQ